MMRNLLVILALLHQTTAFLASPYAGVLSVKHGVAGKALGSHRGSGRDEPTGVSTRKSFIEDAFKASVELSIASSVMVTPQSAVASGGATAGGAYLLSAKQRYNQRVIAGVKAFLALDARDVGAVEAFFASQDEGGWEDFSSAGYLLANAFRTSSTKAPDNLPSVKKWKAYAKDMDLLKRALGKKDGEKVFAAYKVAEEQLDPYLDEVELTSLVR